MSTSLKEEENKCAPKGLGTVDDQGDSSSCVYFSLSKAVADALFLKHKIDVKQNNIMICLIQERKELCDPLAPTNPMKFDKTVLYLQDKRNNRPGLQNRRCWWKVCCNYFVLLSCWGILW